MKRVRFSALLVGVGALVGTVSCTPDIPLPATSTTVRVEMDEYTFALDSEIERGRVVFQTVNIGEEDHEIIVSPLPPDFPPLLEQLRSDTRRTTETFYILPVQEPGERGAFALDLKPGRYGFICFLLNEADETSHAREGMATEFTVR